MPTVPGIGTGLSPLMQWLLLPPAAYLGALRTLGFRAGPRSGLQHAGRLVGAGEQKDCDR